MKNNIKKALSFLAGIAATTFPVLSLAGTCGVSSSAQREKERQQTLNNLTAAQRELVLNEKANVAKEDFLGLEINNKSLKYVYSWLGLKKNDIFFNQDIKIKKTKGSAEVKYIFKDNSSQEAKEISTSFKEFLPKLEVAKEVVKNLDFTTKTKAEFKAAEIKDFMALKDAFDIIGVRDLTSKEKAKTSGITIKIKKDKDADSVTYQLKNELGSPLEIPVTFKYFLDDVEGLTDFDELKAICDYQYPRVHMKKEEFYKYSTEGESVSTKIGMRLSPIWRTPPANEKDLFILDPLIGLTGNEEINYKIFRILRKKKDSYILNVVFCIRYTKDKIVKFYEKELNLDSTDEFGEKLRFDYNEGLTKLTDAVPKTINFTNLSLSHKDFILNENKNIEAGSESSTILAALPDPSRPGYFDYYAGNPNEVDRFNDFLRKYGLTSNVSNWTLEKLNALASLWTKTDELTSRAQSVRYPIYFTANSTIVFFENQFTEKDYGDIILATKPIIIRDFKTTVDEVKNYDWESKSEDLVFGKSPMENLKRDDLFTLFKVKKLGEDNYHYYKMLDYDKDRFTLKDVETNEIRYLSTTKGFGENLEPRISLSTSSDKNESFTKYVEVESAEVLFVQ